MPRRTPASEEVVPTCFKNACWAMHPACVLGGTQHTVESRPENKKRMIFDLPDAVAAALVVES
jgi:hypothetical protein